MKCLTLVASYRIIILTENKVEDKDTRSHRYVDSEDEDEITHFCFPCLCELRI